MADPRAAVIAGGPVEHIVIQSATGKTVRNFFNPEIADKIGIPALPWQTLGLYTKGSSGASFIRPRDLRASAT